MIRGGRVEERATSFRRLPRVLVCLDLLLQLDLEPCLMALRWFKWERRDREWITLKGGGVGERKGWAGITGFDILFGRFALRLPSLLSARIFFSSSISNRTRRR